MLTLKSNIKQQELTEAKREQGGKSKTAVVTFGSFNPPTKGHERVFKKVHSLAGGTGDAFIFPSRTGPDKGEKYPIHPEIKIRILKDFFPEYNFVDDEKVKNPFHAVGYLGDKGYTDIILVVGSDRVEEFTRRFSNPEKFFDSFKIVSGGEREEKNTGVAGMSSTKARNAAKEGDIGKFRAATGWAGEQSENLMMAVRKGLGIK